MYLTRKYSVIKNIILRQKIKDNLLQQKNNPNDKINTGKITSYDLINMKPWELCAIVWKDILEEQSKNDKIIIDKTPTYTTDQFVCTKCKNNKCKTYSLQTRSADEPMTIFVNCITCDNTWRMS